MSLPKLSVLIVGQMLVMLLLAACSGAQTTPAQVSPTAAPTPGPPTATPTLGFANPQPGATLTGEIEVSKVADSGTINLKISEDGTSLTQVDVNMINVSFKCSGGSMESLTESDSMTMFFYGPFSITKGKIDASLSGGGKLKGMFKSPVESSGTISIIRRETTLGISMTCDLGIFDWSAKATPTSSPSTAKLSSEATLSVKLDHPVALMDDKVKLTVTDVRKRGVDLLLTVSIENLANEMVGFASGNLHSGGGKLRGNAEKLREAAGVQDVRTVALKLDGGEEQEIARLGLGGFEGPDFAQFFPPRATGNLILTFTVPDELERFTLHLKIIK